MMNIVLDAMGGDNAPLAVVQGAIDAQKDFTDCNLILVGREEEVRAAFAREGVAELPERISIRNATEVIEMCDDPASAFRKKKDSSMTVGLNMLKNGEGDAFISAGSTGALLSAATLIVKRAKGVRRAAVAPEVPSAAGGMVLIDAGTNAECTPEYLIQFAYMGTFYARDIMGRENPRVGLLNIGTEPSKGDTLHKETFEQLTALCEQGKLNFVGNIEAKECFFGGVDVLVADGFSGNIFLKTVEGTASYMSSLLKAGFKKNLSTKLGYVLAKSGVADLKKVLDPNEVGGSCILGINKPVLKAHGSSNRRAFYCAVRQARAAVSADVCGAIAQSCANMENE